MTKTRSVLSGLFSVALLLIFASTALAFRVPNFTSDTYKAIYRGEKPSSELPYWHGYLLRQRISDDVAPQLTYWTEFLYNEVSKAHALTNTIPHGISHFCPKYVSLSREQRIVFWTRLISIIAGYESAYDPNSTFTEPTMPGVKSTGLLQLSNKSTNTPEYDCNMINHTNLSTATLSLKDPRKNLACGVRIMNHWIGQDGMMVGIGHDGDGPYWKGLARYWGTFRHPSLKDDADSFWNVIDNRRPGWQRESRNRDHLLMTEIREARAKNEDWGNKQWRSRDLAPHPSVLDYLYEKKESHPLTGIVRLANQTAFCF